MFETMVLANLMCHPCHGYELKTYLYRLNPNNNKIYPMLRQLNQKGYVETRTQIQEGRPNRKIYSITEEGKTHFQQLLRDFDFAKAQNADEFNLRVAFSFLLDDKDMGKILELRKNALEHQRNVPDPMYMVGENEDLAQLRQLHTQLREMELGYIERMRGKYSAHT